MKITNKIIILSLFLTLIRPIAANAVNLSTLNIEDVLKNSIVMKDIQDKVAKKREKFQKEIDKKQSKLEMDGKKLDSKKSVLSKEAFAKKEMEFGKKVNKLKIHVNKKQNCLKAASVKAIEKVNTKINDIVTEISEKKNLDIIIPSSQTLFYRNEIDISSEVLKKLNKSITKVDVEFDC